MNEVSSWELLSLSGDETLTRSRAKKLGSEAAAAREAAVGFCWQHL